MTPSQARYGYGAILVGRSRVVEMTAHIEQEMVAGGVLAASAALPAASWLSNRGGTQPFQRLAKQLVSPIHGAFGHDATVGANQGHPAQGNLARQ
jgi:hypothetical protein